MEVTLIDQLRLGSGAAGGLDGAYALGRSDWPEIALSYESFSAHAARHGYTGCSAPLHPADLYLCAACTDGKDSAHRALESRFFSGLRPVVNRIVGEEAVMEEVLQDVRTRLFVGQVPKISSYRGNGPLAGWLRSLAVNVAQDCLRSKVVQRTRLRKLALAQRGDPTTTDLDANDDQLALSACEQVCVQAWCHAIDSLCSEERQILRQCFVYGHSVDALGSHYAVHRATIHRRLRRAIERLRRQVRETLSSHYRDLSDADRDALAFSVGCRLNLSAVLLGDEIDSSLAAAESLPAGGRLAIVAGGELPC